MLMLPDTGPHCCCSHAGNIVAIADQVEMKMCWKVNRSDATGAREV